VTSLGAVRISRANLDQLIEHAGQEAPNECCGYLRAKDGVVEEVFRAVNERNSPYGYELDPKSLFAVNDLDDEGFEVGVYHSHPHSAPVPSPTDLEQAFEEYVYVIAGPVDGSAPFEIRGYRLNRERFVEIQLRATPATDAG